MRSPVPPLEPGWIIVDGRPLYHRTNTNPVSDGRVIVHVHGFGISGTYLEPTAALLAGRFRNFVPDLPGMGRSMRPEHRLDLPGLARALMSYCDEVGVERATFVGNSLGCPIICEVAESFPDRVERAVLVSPAGGPNNQAIMRAARQMAIDGLREPFSMLPIAVRDYLHFGVVQSLSLFKAMRRFPTIDRISALTMPTLVVAGRRDPLVNIDRAHLFGELPHIDVIAVPGAHALNFSDPKLIAALVEAHLDGLPLRTVDGVLSVVEPLTGRH